MLGKYLDLMVSLREPKPEVMKDIQKTHGLSIPHRLHILHNICLLVSILIADSFLTAIHPVTKCNRKCFNFGGHLIFQQNAFNTSTVGPNSSGGLSLSG